MHECRLQRKKAGQEMRYGDAVKVRHELLRISFVFARHSRMVDLAS
jgi:hypothetical protein